MNSIMKIAAMSLVVVLLLAAPALAQEGEGAAQAPTPLITFSAALGAGIVTIGAAMGIGRLASTAVESMARQPEVAGNIQTAMIIAAALIEGFTFFALIVCLVT